MNFKYLQKRVDALGKTLYKEDFTDYFLDRKFKYYIAYNYEQYDGGYNNPERFRTLQEVYEWCLKHRSF